MADIFLSYSRRDADFVTALRDALVEAKRDVWLDTSDIPPTAAWMQEIAAAIDSASAVIVVLSPDYVASEVCGQELAYALENRKKIIPVVCREVRPEDVHPDVRALNWIVFRGPESGSQVFQAILRAIDTDLEYVRGGAKWLVRAHEWESRQRNASFALRGKELVEAEQWVASSGSKVPPPSALALAFINSSRVVERRAQRRTISVLTAGIIVTLVLAIVSSTLFVKTKNDADVIQGQNQQLRLKNLAGRANAALLNGQIEQGLLLSVAANKDARNGSFETRDALFTALEYSPYLEKVLQSRNDARAIADDLLVTRFSQDGDTLMTANLNGTISIWDMSAKKLRASFNRDADTVDSAALSPNGRTVVTIGTRGLKVWDVASKTMSRQLLPSEPTHGSSANQQLIAFTADGSDVITPYCPDASCSSGQLVFWNVTTGQRDHTLPLDTPPYQIVLALSPDGKMLAAVYCDSRSCTGRNTFTLWDVASQTRLLSVPLADLNSVNTIAFNPKGSLIALGGHLRATEDVFDAVELWRVDTHQRDGTPIVRNNDEFTSLAFDRDGSHLLAGGDFGSLRLYDVDRRVPVGEPLRGHTGIVFSVAFRPGSDEFVSAGSDDLLLLWGNHPNTPYSLPLQLGLDGDSQGAFSPDRQYLATGYFGDVVVWNLASGQPEKLLDRPQDGDLAYALAYSPDGRYIASGGVTSGKVLLWDTTTLKPSGDPLVGHTPGNRIEHLAFSPNGKYLVSCGTDGRVVLWDVASHQALKTFQNTLNGNVDELLYSAAFSPDSSTLIMGSAGNSKLGASFRYPLLRWDIAGNKEMPSWYGHSATVRAATYSNDGKYIASLGDTGEVVLWDAHTGALLARASTPQDSVTSHATIAFSPDDQTVLASHDSVAVLWDVSNIRKPELLVHPLVAPAEILNTAISPDGRLWLLAQVSSPLTIRYLQPSDWQRQACAIVNRDFTNAEAQAYDLHGAEAHPCQQA